MDCLLCHNAVMDDRELLNVIERAHKDVMKVLIAFGRTQVPGADTSDSARKDALDELQKAEELLGRYR